MRKIVRKKNKKSGFTLIEMLIVLVVVGLLMAIIIPNVSGQRDRINQQAATNISEILETQYNTYILAEPSVDPEKVTLVDLLDGGYITVKQAEQAKTLLNITDASTLPVSPPNVTP